MLNRDESVLLSVALVACSAGYLLAGAAAATGPLPSLCLIAMMFLSYLSIPMKDVAEAAVESRRGVLLLTGAKMVVLPLAVGGATMLINKEYAVVMILMAGICSGSSCPYFGLLLKADTPFLVVLVVATSLAAPITLPLMIRLLCGGHVDVSPWGLGLSLSLYILMPMIMAEVCRSVSDRVSRLLISNRKGINIALFGVTNFAVFANNAAAISVGGEKILSCFVFSCLAAILFMLCGYLSALHLSEGQRTASMISFAMTNNILVIVLCGSYFGSTELLVAAMYTIPFFLVTIPIRHLSKLKTAIA